MMGDIRNQTKQWKLNSKSTNSRKVNLKLGKTMAWTVYFDSMISTVPEDHYNDDSIGNVTNLILLSPILIIIDY
jgi:hypothetical protein